MRAEECPKKDEVKDDEGGNTSSAPPTSATVPSVGAGDEIQVEAETEKSIEIAAKAQTDMMDVSHHEDRCFACKDGGGEFFYFGVSIPRLCSSYALLFTLHILISDWVYLSIDDRVPLTAL